LVGEGTTSGPYFMRYTLLIWGFRDPAIAFKSRNREISKSAILP